MFLSNFRLTFLIQKLKVIGKKYRFRTHRTVKQQARNRGKRKEAIAIAIAKEMKNGDLPTSQTVEFTKLSIKEIEKLKTHLSYTFQYPPVFGAPRNSIFFSFLRIFSHL